ncbi:MAG: glucose-6-phosphate isomerase [Chlamydiales bacterium]|nr:glucose-6-phosphate isomerase [Chlamydiales bacterium]
MITQTKSWKKLENLSAHPIDLTKEGALSVQRVESYVMRGCGFDLFYGTERVNDEVIQALWDLGQETSALEKMEAMQRGEIINKIDGFESEERSVLHTAMRDVFESRPETKAAKEAADLALRELNKLEKFLEKIGDGYTDLIQIGIGGSDLGPRALCIALEPFHKPGRKIHFISNVDPDDAARVLSQIDPKRTLVVVVSKSGSTLETLTNEELAREKFLTAKVDPKKHFIAVTGEKSPMDDPSRYLASFYIWDFVGGRYSATSMVGAVMLGFAIGFIELMNLLRGAHAMDVHAKTAGPAENLPLFSALLGVWNRNFLHLPTVAIIPYSQALVRFPAHLQQLDMESNGKSIDRQGKKCAYATGPVIWGEPGTNGQHSFYQLIHQGTDVVPVEFIGFRHSQSNQDLSIQKTTSQQKLLSNLFAQSIALAVGQHSQNPNKIFPGNRPNRILFADRLDPYTLGALLAFYEHKVAFQGFIWNINSFDQEGVQLGKVLANKMISLFSKEAKPSSFPLGAALLELLD